MSGLRQERLQGVAFAAGALLLACTGARAGGDASDDRAILDQSFAACLANPVVAAADKAAPTEQSIPPERLTPPYKKRHAEVMKVEPKLESVCPDLVDRVAASDFGKLLPEDWHKRISGRRLEELRAALAARERALGARELSLATLKAAVSHVQAEQKAPPLSLWRRLKNWIDGLFERQARAGHPEGWFSELIEKLERSQRAVRIFYYTMLVAIVAAALAIVYVELRAAGFLTRRAADGRKRRAASGGAKRAAVLALAGVARVPLTERPALLIQRLIESCVATGRLRERRSFTHRELAGAAHFEATDDSASFAHVLYVAEAVRYAGEAPDTQTLDEAVRQGEALLARLAPGRGAVP